MSLKMAKKTKKKTTVHKLLAPHSIGCAYFNGHNDDAYPWCLPKLEHLKLDCTGRRNHRASTGFYVYRCNDPACFAKLAVHACNADTLVGLTTELRNLGKPEAAPCRTK